MDVVVRGLQASGLAVFAAMHGLEALEVSSPAWLPVAFWLAAVVAVGLAAVLFLVREEGEVLWERISAAFAAAAALALILSLTVGFLGVSNEDLTTTAVLALVAEAMVLGAYLIRVIVSSDPSSEEDIVSAP